MRDFLLDLAGRLGIDRAVFYALLARGWRAVGGLISILLIAKFLTPETQGYYYTFQSLIALQVFVELGLVVVVISVTSHEWAKLQLNEEGVIIGDLGALSRLVSFGRKLASWYAVAAVVFVLLVAPAGALFLAKKGGVEGWLGPWIFAVLFQAMLLWTAPFQALFEGCNQVVAIQRFQLWQGILANVVLWICLASGAGLWSVAALIGIQAAITMYYLGIFNHAQRRIEMHLESRVAQNVLVCDRVIAFEPGETIHTESSYKYTVESFQALAAQAGWSPVAVWTDPKGYFSLHALHRA